MESGFEQRFASRESTLASRDGFQGFLLLRRDGAPDDGFTHSTLSVWRDKARRWGRAEREGVWGGWKSVAGDTPSAANRRPSKRGGDPRTARGSQSRAEEEGREERTAREGRPRGRRRCSRSRPSRRFTRAFSCLSRRAAFERGQRALLSRCVYGSIDVPRPLSSVSGARKR